MLKTVKYANLALAFFLELLMLADFLYWGFVTGNGLLLQIVLGIGVPLVVAIIWGILLAPNSPRRLTGISELVAKVIIFGLASLALASAGQPILGLALAIVFIVNYVLLVALGPVAS